VALEGTAGAVRVALEHGTGETFDLVVGADGSRSPVRDLAFGEVDRTESGSVVWRGWFQERDVDLDLSPMADGTICSVAWTRGQQNYWLVPSLGGGAPGERVMTFITYDPMAGVIDARRRAA